jgi:NADPH:quinone reductase-like Zn-dependent oxidoreductase
MARAVVATGYGGPENLAVVDVEVPEPVAGQVRVEVRACGVNPIDHKLYRGGSGEEPGRLPMRLGFEVAGVVSGVGDDAQGPAGPVRIGDEVLAYPVDGGYAEAVTVPASAVIPKPAEMPFEQAAGLLLTGVTAYHLVEATGVRAGDTVLVHAASGGVGLIAAQLAVERDATVIGTASERHHDRLRGHGVVPVAYGDGLADRVRDLAPGGVDVALDTVGTDEAVDVSLALVTDRRRIATIAAFGRAPEAGIQLLGNGPGADPGDDIRSRGRLVLTDLVRRGRLRVEVARTFGLTDAAEAHRLVAGGHAGGKVVLLP